MESDENLKVPPPKLQKTDVLQHLQETPQSDDENMPTDTMNEQSPDERHRWNYDFDPFLTGVMQTNTYSALLGKDDAHKFSEVFIYEDDEISWRKAHLDLLLRLFKITHAQNFKMNEQLNKIAKQNQFLTEQNIKLSDEVSRLKSSINSLRFSESPQSTLDNMQPQPYLKAASSHVNSISQPNLSSSAIPFRVGIAHANGSPHITGSSHAHRNQLYPLQIYSTACFKTTEELREKLLRPIALERHLPIIKNVTKAKQKGQLSDNCFLLMFTQETDRAIWLDTIGSLPQHFITQNTSFGFHPKIILHGVPDTYVNDEENLSEKIALSLQCDNSQIHFLFSYQSYQSDSIRKYVYSVHPSVRKALWKQNDRFSITGENFITEVSDFIQPLQCRNCYCFGHSTKNCTAKISCKQCNSTNCKIPEDQTCPEKRCINCRGDHYSFERNKCPVYNDLIQKTTQKLRELKLQTIS
jgi:hypothetical protein